MVDRAAVAQRLPLSKNASAVVVSESEKGISSFSILRTKVPFNRSKVVIAL